MKAARLRRLAATTGTLVFLCTSSASCQSAYEGNGPHVEPNDLRASKLAAYCMWQEETVSRPGRDGLTIKLTTQIHTCRDTAGRMKTERSFEYHPSASSAAPARTDLLGWNVFLVDPVAGTFMIWTTLSVDQRRVMVSHFKPSIPHPDVAPLPQIRQTLGDDGSHRPTLILEPIGTRAIQGTVAQGNRERRFHPAGREGNNMDYTGTIENWFSAECGGILLE